MGCGWRCVVEICLDTCFFFFKVISKTSNIHCNPQTGWPFIKISQTHGHHLVTFSSRMFGYKEPQLCFVPCCTLPNWIPNLLTFIPGRQIKRRHSLCQQMWDKDRQFLTKSVYSSLDWRPEKLMLTHQLIWNNSLSCISPGNLTDQIFRGGSLSDLGDRCEIQINISSSWYLAVIVFTSS